MFEIVKLRKLESGASLQGVMEVEQVCKIIGKMLEIIKSFRQNLERRKLTLITVGCCLSFDIS